MKKFIVGFIAIIIAGIIVVSFPFSKDEKDEQIPKDSIGKDTLDDSDYFCIETLSDKDIYFHGPAVCLTYASQETRKLYDDMVKLANGYAILRAAYCDAELWFRFGMIVNDSIRKIEIWPAWDDKMQADAKKYVNTLVDILPRDTALWNQSDSVLWDKVWRAYTTYADKLSKRFALNHYGKITEKDVARYMDIEQFIPNYDSTDSKF